MTDPDRRQSDDEDDRSDMQQAVDARSDALARGEGGDAPPAGVGGEGGASGVVRNQEGDDQ